MLEITKAAHSKDTVKQQFIKPLIDGEGEQMSVRYDAHTCLQIILITISAMLFLKCQTLCGHFLLFNFQTETYLLRKMSTYVTLIPL